MQQAVSKSQFKPQALEYLRRVELTKKPLIITHFGKPVIKIEPYSERAEDQLKFFRGTVEYYKKPYDPVGLDDWEALK